MCVVSTVSGKLELYDADAGITTGELRADDPAGALREQSADGGFQSIPGRDRRDTA
jgi:hypothetical protein